ncbi:MAG: DUF1361 domain-containing protein [Armatimonadota bacterium]
MLGLVRWVAWNSILALIPVGLAYLVVRLAGPHRASRSWPRKILLLSLGLLWFIFLPNTCYLLTGWRHFLSLVTRADLYTRWQMGDDAEALAWLILATTFFALYSGFGMFTFTLAIRPIARWMRHHGAMLWLWGIPFFFLMSLGVYLGLVLRFNSWNIFYQLGDIWSAVINALTRPKLAALIVAFGGFLWIAYLFIDIWIDGLLLRMGRTSVESSGVEVTTSNNLGD